MKGDKHHHHYIPNFILRRYSYDSDPKKSKAHLVDLLKGEVSKVVKTKKMYCENDLYRYRIEDAIGKHYEEPVSSLLTKIEKSQGTVDVSLKELLTLRKYLLLQLIRTRVEKDSYSDIPRVWEKMINKIVSNESL